MRFIVLSFVLCTPLQGALLVGFRQLCAVFWISSRALPQSFDALTLNLEPLGDLSVGPAGEAHARYG